jgi:hypothetical protein
VDCACERVSFPEGYSRFGSAACCGPSVSGGVQDDSPLGLSTPLSILQENHTFDNYFGTFSGADGATSGLTSAGLIVSLTPLPDMDYDNLCNSWDCALLAMDGGKMDNFDLINGGLSAYTQASSQEIPHYWECAHQFVLADRYFTSVHGPSFPNHLFTVAARRSDRQRVRRQRRCGLRWQSDRHGHRHRRPW